MKWLPMSAVLSFTSAGLPLAAGCGAESTPLPVASIPGPTASTGGSTTNDAERPLPQDPAVAWSASSAPVVATATIVGPPGSLFVSEYRVDCSGKGYREKCLQVRQREGQPWQSMSAAHGIEGFRYEDGHKYELKVSFVRVEDGEGTFLLDASRWRLVEVVSDQTMKPP